MVSTNDMINGIMRYADREVVTQLPTMGKWLLGTGLGVAGKKASDLAHDLENNQLLKTLGVVDADGRWDTDMIMDEMLQNAHKYGKATIDVPIIGSMTFSEADVQKLFRYISGEM